MEVMSKTSRSLRQLVLRTQYQSSPNTSPARPRVCSWHNLNPLNWSRRAIKVFTVSFFSIMLPIYIFIGLQPILPAEAANYPVLEIPTIHLKTPVAPLELDNQQLIAPATIAGSYSHAANKTLLIGHSSTVFAKLERMRVGDHFQYEDKTFEVTEITTQPKSTISMNDILAPAAQNTIIIMTCAGEPLPNQDATHRLLVTALQV